MHETTLAQAVLQFAQVAHGMCDADLERPWAWGAYDSEGIRFAFFRTYEELRELAIRLERERVKDGCVATSAQRILARYHSAFRDLQALLKGVGTQDADHALAEGEWPVRQVLAHIVGAEIGFYAVVRYALERHRAGLDLPAETPREAWSTVIDEAAFDALVEGPLEEMQSYYAELHQRVLNEFAEVTEEELELPSKYWEGIPLSFRFRLHRFESHLRQHTIQVEKTLDGIGRPYTELQRLVRLVYGGLADAEGAALGAPHAGSELQQDVAARIAARAAEISALLS